MVSISNELSTPFVLGNHAGQQFAEQGFIRLKGVLSQGTINTYGPAITQRVIELNTMHLPLEERSTYQKAFLQVTNLWQHNEPGRGARVFQPAWLGFRGELLGARAPRPGQDQAL